MSDRDVGPCSAESTERELVSQTVGEDPAVIGRWLFTGGLSYPDGAIAAWRDTEDDRLSYPYPEITGYFLTLAAGLGSADSACVQGAARWLIDRHSSGECESRPTEPGVIYTFDTAMQAVGLLNHGIAANCLEASMLGIRLLTSEAHRILDYGDVQPLGDGSRLPARPPTWSTHGRLHLLKLVQGLCLISERFGVDAGLAAAQLIVSQHTEQLYLLSDQLVDADGQRYLHPMCYALEGLWVWEAATGDESAGQILRIQLDSLLMHQLPSGGMPGTVGSAIAQLDVTAQVVRLGALLAVDTAALRKMSRFLRRQIRTAGPGMGALPYRPSDPTHQTAWVSMFALQALAFVPHHHDWRYLV